MLFKIMLPQSIRIFIIEHRYMFKEIFKNHKKKLRKKIRKDSFLVDDIDNWISKFNRLTYSNGKLIELANEFMNSKITVLQDRDVSDNDVIAICVHKNDLMRLKRFIDHHRKLGIDKFVILDNDSDDDSINYLLKQNDVILLSTKIPYTSVRRNAWINRIIAHYGYNRWYLVMDSDEILVYNNCENKNIKDLIRYANNNKITRLRALLLDMYAKSDYYVNDNKNYYKELIYFDTNTYYKHNDYRFYNIKGGPRERVFKFSPCLTKYPLFYFKKDDIYVKSHFLYPYKDNYKSDCLLVLKHYKFLASDKEKIRLIVKQGNYYNNSIEYKHYVKVIDKNNKLDFINKDTCKYFDSKSLDNILVYKKVNWK